MSLASFSLIIGVFCYVFGFPQVFCDEKHLAWRKKMMKDENMLRVIATAFIAIAAITLKYQWHITPDGEGLVIAIAWATLLKALFVAWWPAQYCKLSEKFDDFLSETQQLQVFMGFLLVLLGALFTYLGLILA